MTVSSITGNLGEAYKAQMLIQNTHNITAALDSAASLRESLAVELDCSFIQCHFQLARYK
jgi:hypothetical protein